MIGRSGCRKGLTGGNGGSKNGKKSHLPISDTVDSKKGNLQLVMLLMAEILHLRCIKPVVNTGINYLSLNW